MKYTLQRTIRWATALTTLGYLWALSIAGCGYSFAGRSEAFPNDIRTVYIEPFINQTRNVGLEKELTSALRSEFYRGGQLRLGDTVDQADGIVAGVVRSFRQPCRFRQPQG